MTVIPRAVVTAARSLLVLAVVTAAVLLNAPSASAHASLVSTDPADGSTRADEPSRVSLEFNQNIGTPAYVVVTAPDGSHVQSGDPKVVDNTVTQSLDRSGIAGEYTISYRVVSADGHPVEGTISYTVENGRTVAADQAKGESEEQGSFVERHRSHLLWGLGGIAVAAALLLWPRRRDDA